MLLILHSIIGREENKKIVRFVNLHFVLLQCCEVASLDAPMHGLKRQTGHAQNAEAYVRLNKQRSLRHRAQDRWQKSVH